MTRLGSRELPRPAIGMIGATLLVIIGFAVYFAGQYLGLSHAKPKIVLRRKSPAKPIQLPGSKMTGTSSGRAALVLMLILVFAVVSYVLLGPGSLVGGPPVGESASAPTTSSTTTSTTTHTKSSATQSQTTSPGSAIDAGGTSGPLGGSFPKGGSFDVTLNSSMYAELVWNASGIIDVHLYNTTGGLAFSRTGQQSGNYTFCVPTTGSYNIKFQDPNVLVNAPVIQSSVYVYEIKGGACSPSP